MIAIPAAGKGTRFREAGYEQPKHLIPLVGIPMIDRVVSNVKNLAPGPICVLTQDVVGETRGTAETVALGVPTDCGELLVANCDQLLKFPEYWKEGDGVVFTFPSVCPAHSYVITDPVGVITDIREKQVVGRQAVSGVYWFRDGNGIVDACQKVTSYLRDEMYLSLALQELIHEGAELFAVDAPTAILGTPEDLQRFEVAMSLCF